MRLGGRRVSPCARPSEFRLSEQLLAIITEECEALERPIEESERRIAVMKETIAEAERSMRELEFLWMAGWRTAKLCDPVAAGFHPAPARLRSQSASRHYRVGAQRSCAWVRRAERPIEALKFFRRSLSRQQPLSLMVSVSSLLGSLRGSFCRFLHRL